MDAPVPTISAKHWYKFPATNVSGIYYVSDQNTAVYIGQGDPVGGRLAKHLSGWSDSDLWYKCAPPSQNVAWFQLIERWIISLLAAVDGGEAERRAQEAQFISTYRPLLNDIGHEPLKFVLERRYKYLQDTGIAGLYRNHAEREAFQAQYPELF
jgi:hypothetical protein